MADRHIINWLTSAPSLEETKRGAFQNIVYTAAIALTLYVLLTLLVFQGLRPGIYIGVATALAMGALGGWASRRHAIKWPAMVLTALALVATTATAVINGGADGNVAPFFVVAPLLAGLFLGTRLAFIAGVAAVLCIFGLVAADNYGLITETPYNIAAQRIAAASALTAVIIMTMAGTTYFAQRMRDYANGLAQSQELLSAFARNAPIAVAMFDKHMRYMEVSDRWLTDYGATREKLIGKSHYALYPRITDERKDIHRRCLAGDTARGEYDRFEREDGTPYWLAWEVRPWRKPNGAIGGIIMITRDITEHYEAKLRLEETNRKAEAASAAKSMFLANMSHEIRTPLNGVLGMAQSLSADGLAPAQQDKVRTIIQSGEILLAVLNDVLDLSKIEAGKIHIEPRDASLLDALDHVMRLFRPAAAEKSLDFHLHVDEAAPDWLVFDSVRVRQCLSNLISNALKFTHEGRIDITVSAQRVSEDDVEVEIRVRDTGVGISEDVQKKLFTAFSQGDASTSRQYGGTGLGLAITRMLARKMGGDVAVKSVPGEGSVFIFRFEAAIADADVNAADEADAVDHPLGIDRLDGARILIVDDNAVNRKVARTFLEPYGARLVEAENGEIALERLARHAFDLVLLDIHMPVLDGPNTLARMRKIDGLADLPTIALTADAISGDEEKYLAMGMDGYVSKPFTQEALAAAAVEALAQRDEVRQLADKHGGAAAG